MSILPPPCEYDSKQPSLRFVVDAIFKNVSGTLQTDLEYIKFNPSPNYKHLPSIHIPLDDIVGFETNVNYLKIEIVTPKEIFIFSIANPNEKFKGSEAISIFQQAMNNIYIARQHSKNKMVDSHQDLSSEKTSSLQSTDPYLSQEKNASNEMIPKKVLKKNGDLSETTTMMIDRNKTKQREKNSIAQIKVSDPRQETNHVSYRISYRTNSCDGKKYEADIRRRYNDFLILWRNLVLSYARVTKIPDLPPKTAINKFNPSFLKDRCQWLDQWISNVVKDRHLGTSTQLFSFLEFDFVYPYSVSKNNSAGGLLQLIMSPLVDNRILNIAEKKYQNWSRGQQKKTIHASNVEQDYAELKQLMLKYKVTPSKQPFPKFVTILLGSTNSGKSAFINHIFGIQLKKISHHQQDTEFTIIEVIPCEVFWQMSATKDIVAHDSQYDELKLIVDNLRSITAQQLLEPMEDYDSDWRFGRVFHRLSTEQALARYEQLLPHANDGLFRAFLINEAALDIKNAQFDLAKNSILIDSPGLSSVQAIDIPEKFMGNLNLLQYLYNISDLLLYFVSCGQIPTLANQIPMLELLVMYANYGEKFCDETIKKTFLKQKESKNSSNFFSLTIPAITSSLIKEAKRLFGSDISVCKEYQNQYKGSNVWHKTLFVLSKVDILLQQSQSNKMANSLLSQYYELGILLGQSLRALHPPTYDQCLVIGLPECQVADINLNEIPFTGELELLKAKIRSREHDAPYLLRLERAIQQMCEELEKEFEKPGSYLSCLYSLTVKSLRSKSLERIKNGIN